MPTAGVPLPKFVVRFHIDREDGEALSCNLLIFQGVGKVPEVALAVPFKGGLAAKDVAKAKIIGNPPATHLPTTGAYEATAFGKRKQRLFGILRFGSATNLGQPFIFWW